MSSSFPIPDRRSASPPPPPADAMDENSGSESDLELDSPPRIIMIDPTEDVDPTFPPRSPPPTASPKGCTFGSDNEKWYSSGDKDDFTIPAGHVGKSRSLDDYIAAAIWRNSYLYAEIALKHYNSDEKNKIKYDLVSVTEIGGMIDINGCYDHLNFTAKGKQQDSKEQLFFAELRTSRKPYVTTCVVSLEGRKVGGLRDSKNDHLMFDEIGLAIDEKHCYACGKGLMHPKDVSYEGGHIAESDFYHG